MRILADGEELFAGKVRPYKPSVMESFPLPAKAIQHAQAMALIRGLVVNAPIRMGDVVLENLLNTNINLIASMDIDRA